MSVRIVGTLLDPFDNPYPNTCIRVVTVIGSGSTLVNAVEEYFTDAEGLYDFNLADGTHAFYIVWEKTLEFIGCATVNEGSPDPTDIQGIIDYATPIVIPPPLSECPNWCNLYEDVICSPDSIGSCTTEIQGAGDAHYQETIKTFCNTRLGASYAEHSDVVCTGLTDCTIEQVQSYTDTSGSSSAYCTSDIYSQDQCDISRISLTKDGVGNICNEKEEIFCTNSYKEISNILVSNDCTLITEEQSNSAYLETENQALDVNGSSTVINQNISGIDVVSEEHVRNSYVENHATVNAPITCNTTINSIGSDLCTLIEEVSKEDESGGLVTYSNYCSEVMGEIASRELTNDGSSHIRQAAGCHEIGTYRDGVFYPNVTIDSDNNCLTFCGYVDFCACNCDIFQGPPGDSERLELQYSPNKTGPWDNTLDTGDIWQRYRTVTTSGIDGSITYGDWLGPFNLYAQDGLDGDTLYIEYEYSVDGLVDWHDILVEGDNYRRERRVSHDVPGDWSIPARITGDDGIDGTGVSVVYDYSTNALATEPNWHPNLSEGDYWRRERYYSTIAGVVAEDPYNTVIIKILPEKGVDYYDGVDTKTVSLITTTQAFVYDSDGINPNPLTAVFTATPSETIVNTPYYYFYVDEVLVQEGTDAEYIYTAPLTSADMPQIVGVEITEEIDGVVSPDIVAGDQVTVVGLVDGASGYDGITVVLSNEAHTFPATHLGNVLSYANGGTEIQVYIGAEALGYGYEVNEYVVSAAGSNITPDSNPTTVGNSRVYGDPSNMNNDFAEISFTITIQYEGIGPVQIRKVQSFALSKEGESGAPGDDGEAGAGYYSFEGTMPSTDEGRTTCFIIEVGREPVGGDTFVAYNEFTCSTTAYQYNSSNGSWITPTMKIDGGLVVTGTIGAQQIAAYSISGEKIQSNTKIVVGPACTGNDVVTLDGVDAVWRVAVGCACYECAPFRVTKLGGFYATDAYISGDICATSGTFTGTICASSGCFSGTLGAGVVDTEVIVGGAVSQVSAGSAAGFTLSAGASTTALYLASNIPIGFTGNALINVSYQGEASGDNTNLGIAIYNNDTGAQLAGRAVSIHENFVGSGSYSFLDAGAVAGTTYRFEIFNNYTAGTLINGAMTANILTTLR